MHRHNRQRNDFRNFIRMKSSEFFFQSGKSPGGEL
jgi:hypothetical protein